MDLVSRGQSVSDSRRSISSYFPVVEELCWTGNLVIHRSHADAQQWQFDTTSAGHCLRQHLLNCLNGPLDKTVGSRSKPLNVWYCRSQLVQVLRVQRIFVWWCWWQLGLYMEQLSDEREFGIVVRCDEKVPNTYQGRVGRVCWRRVSRGCACARAAVHQCLSFVMPTQYTVSRCQLSFLTTLVALLLCSRDHIVL